MLKRIGQSIDYRSKSVLLKLINKQYNFRNHIIIAANPRGGSTWLEQIFALVPNSVTYYEPLNDAYNHHVRDLGFYRHQAIPQYESWPEAKQFFTKLFSGQIPVHRMVFHPKSSGNKLYRYLFSK
jgi:hypothetical protein